MSSVLIFTRALMVYTVFVPIRGDGVWLYAGITVFVLGSIAHTSALINFATTSPDKPVVKGIYQYSRYPMLIMGILSYENRI